MTHIGNTIGNEYWSHFNSLSSEVSKHLVDVRTPEEFKEDGIADIDDIKLIPYILFNPIQRLNTEFLDELDKQIPNKDDAVFFICRSGQRSYNAAELAAKAGYTKVFNISGGYLYNEIKRKQCK